MNDVRLDEFDKDEWRDVARILCPGLTDEQFDVMWEEFIAMKYGKTLH